ncbi:tetratricopeptide repeat protein [Alcanivorax sp. S6407]|uniref:tetratricopeptide repeat protein n=1 Tax=Alcanivorax sp. S6407 TaxID=2926424 RepID=UPI001FF34536|nr:tetratricopeptide repeat protein [Alcanivorax sp. S6407]MCK0152333.1 tetratricopeptide repeat protein [Alcanivorax sp. S6407]
MKRGQLKQWLLAACVAGTCATAQAAKVEFFDEIDTGPAELSLEQHRYLAFGEVMYDFYRHATFDAINLLLVNQQQSLFDDDTDYAELLLGDLYVTYGLPDSAETIFNRLLKKDILSHTRAQTWLHKAALHYREGNLTEAAMILDDKKVDGLEPEEEARRKLMLANILMAEGDFSGALDYLHGVPVETDEGRYATYNMGVALIRGGHEKDGLALLNSLLPLSASSGQALALRDRAALAAGLTQLRSGELAGAQSSLRQVRSDGPFSEDALLALGLTNYRAGAIKRALPLWLEAVNRNSSHPSVQEALMLAPRAYEELGGMPQALAGYKYAATQYREALKDIQRAIENIGQRGWADNLLPDDVNETGFLPANTDTLAQGGQLSYLYKLFSSNTFAQRFQNYRQIHQIKSMVEHWERSLPALMESYQIQQRGLGQHLPKVRQQIGIHQKQQEALMLASDKLGMNIPDYVDMSSPGDVANAGQAIMWKKVDSLSRQFGTLPGSNHANALRLRRVRGLLLWDIAHQSMEQREKQIQAATELEEESRILAERVAAVSLQIRDATLRTRDDLGQRLAQQQSRIDEIKRMSEDTLAALEQSMQADALALLRANQKKLADQLAEAHLAVARLQDTSVTSDTKQRTGS